MHKFKNKNTEKLYERTSINEFLQKLVLAYEETHLIFSS